MQKDADKLTGETKKQRTSLGSVFATEYKNKILYNFDIENLANSLIKQGIQSVVFFCVEEHAEACHRSIVASKLAEILNTNVINL